MITTTALKPIFPKNVLKEIFHKFQLAVLQAAWPMNNEYFLIRKRLLIQLA